jgi:hypothetical protein
MRFSLALLLLFAVMAVGAIGAIVEAALVH